MVLQNLDGITRTHVIETGKLNLTRVIWRLSSLDFFSSPSTPSSPTPARLGFGLGFLGFRVAGGALLTTGLRRRAGGGKPAQRWW